jgi:hypothetical protein
MSAWWVKSTSFIKGICGELKRNGFTVGPPFPYTESAVIMTNPQIRLGLAFLLAFFGQNGSLFE